MEDTCAEVVNSITCIKVGYPGCYFILLWNEVEKKKVGLARKSRGCVWYVFVNSTVPFHHRWVEEKGSNLNPEYFLSLHAINSIALLCTYRVVYCSTFKKGTRFFFFLEIFLGHAKCPMQCTYNI